MTAHPPLGHMLSRVRQSGTRVSTGEVGHTYCRLPARREGEWGGVGLLRGGGVGGRVDVQRL